MSKPNDTTCSYCVRNTAEFEDLDGDPICDDCSLPEGEGGESMSDETFTTCEECYSQVLAIHSRRHEDWHAEMERQLRGWS